MHSPVKSKVKYSPQEARLLGLLPKSGNPISSIDLSKKLYDGIKAPRYPRQSMTSIMLSLMEKVEENKEPFTISKTPPGGPHPAEYRKNKR